MGPEVLNLPFYKEMYQGFSELSGHALWNCSSSQDKNILQYKNGQYIRILIVYGTLHRTETQETSSL